MSIELPQLNPLQERDRHIIVDGSSTIGGIFVCRASIVVDVDENPGVYQEVVDAVDESLLKRDWAEIVYPVDILESVYSIVDKRFLPYDTKAYAQVLREEAEARNKERLDKEDQIGLSRFFNVGGICQQQALMFSAVLELLQIRGDLTVEKVGIESADIFGEEFVDRHIGAQVIGLDGEEFLLDTLHGVLSTNYR
jgi:hypothetical protein